MSQAARPMKYPYTYSAKIAQFPLKFYYNTQWIYRYYFLSFAITVPLFWWITKKVNSPEYVAQHEENMKRMRAKDAAVHAARRH